MDFRDQVLLAPLTKGGNLPYRRLCVDFGARITMSEMAYARQVVRSSRPEMALLRRHDSEGCFGVQIAARDPEDAVKAGKIAADRGAVFVDLNCGCPIHDVVRRGMGATLLQRPKALQRIVEAMVEALDVAVTVKIRSGWKAGEVNAPEVARLVEEAGAAMLVVHPRSREQRYARAADWDLVAQIVRERSIPVCGNGDLLTWHEVEDRRAQSNCAAVMVARGALIKPWIFREIEERSTWLPTAEERVDVYYRFIGYCREHFGDDAKGRKKAMFFLPWHFGFFCRWRPMPEAEFVERAHEHPLLQTRLDAETDLPALELLLRDPRVEVHQRIADVLWESTSVADAVGGLGALAEATPPPETDAPDEVPVSHG